MYTHEENFHFIWAGGRNVSETCERERSPTKFGQGRGKSTKSAWLMQEKSDTTRTYVLSFNRKST